MDADKMLDEIRQVFAEIGETAYSEPLADSRMRVTNLAVRVMGHFGRFDSYLSQGGTPPSDWAGGPDVPDEHIYVPAFDRPPVRPRPEAVRKAAARLQAELNANADAIGAILSEDVEPLGGPVPGVDGSHLPDDDVVQVLDERMLPPRRHLPEHPDQGCVRCGNPITWDGEAWVHVRDGVVRHPARAGLWPGAAIANDEPGR